MGGDKDPKKGPKIELGYDINEILEKAKVSDDKKGPAEKKDDGKPEERIERVSDLVEGDFEEVPEEEEEMGPKDEAIQNYIMDLEADLDEKIASLDAERSKRAQLESEVEELKKGLEKAHKEDEADDTVQGYLADLEADLKLKIEDIEKERKERERLEKELAEMKSKIASSSKSRDEVANIKAELVRTKATSDVEIARLETEQSRKEQDTASFKSRIGELEDELKRKISFIEDMRSKTSDSEASIIDFKERVKALEHQLESERRKGRDASTRAEDLASELQKMRDALSTKIEEVEKVRTDLGSLDALRNRLEDASSKLDQESKERVRAESEVGKLRDNLAGIMDGLQSDLSRYKEGEEKALKDLEAERRRKSQIETELTELKSQIDASASETQKELMALREERDRLKSENSEKERAIEAEMLKINVTKEELAVQKQALEEERSSLEAMRSRTEKDINERSSDYAMRDVRFEAEYEGLTRERDQLERKNHELEGREKQIVEREKALRDKESKLRNELRSKALGLSSSGPEPEHGTVPTEAQEGPETEATVKEEGPIEEGTPEEPLTPVPAGPRIWPPLSSMKGSEEKVPARGTEADRPSKPKGEMKMGLPSTYVPEKKAEAKPKKRPRRQFLWPDHAYEAEARIKNVAYDPSKDTPGSSAVGTRRLIDNYVSAKVEPVTRPMERPLHCICGAEFFATTMPSTGAVVCPKCGRRLL